MNKNEFLMRLRKALASLPFEECQSAMKYYEEYFAEAGEDREGEILKELGNPEMLAATILGEYSSAPAHVSDVRTSAATAGYSDARYSSASGYGEDREAPQEPWYRRTPLWVLVLLGIVLCPIIFPLIGAVISVLCALLGVVAALIGVMASVGIAGIGIGVSGVVMILVGAVRTVLNPAVGIMTMGVGMLFIAIGILAVIAAICLFSKVIPAVYRVIPSVYRAFVSLIRSIFNRGGTSR